MAAPISGTVVGRIDAPTPNPKRNGQLTGIVVQTDDRHWATLLYVTPNRDVVAGTRIERGQTQLGVTQNVAAAYGRGMTNHLHMNFERAYPIPDNEDGTPSRLPPMYMYIDPSRYIREN